MFDTRIFRYKLKKLTDDFFELNNARLKKKKKNKENLTLEILKKTFDKWCTLKISKFGSAFFTKKKNMSVSFFKILEF